MGGVRYRYQGGCERHTASRRFTQKAKRVFSKVTGFPSRKGPLSRQLYVWDLPDALCGST